MKNESLTSIVSKEVIASLNHNYCGPSDPVSIRTESLVRLSHYLEEYGLVIDAGKRRDIIKMIFSALLQDMDDVS